MDRVIFCAFDKRSMDASLRSLDPAKPKHPLMRTRMPIAGELFELLKLRKLPFTNVMFFKIREAHADICEGYFGALQFGYDIFYLLLHIAFPK
jgi:hypothetical protein